MCWRLEFNRTTKEARNKLTSSRLILNIIGVLLVVALGAVAAVIAIKASEWFPTYKGSDGIYKRITKADSRALNLTMKDAEAYCTNYNQSLLMVGRMAYRCGNDNKGECITMDNRCDGYKDCTDDSDEEGCDNFCKSATQAGVRFTCKVVNNKTKQVEDKCMHTAYKCDGEVDCTGENKDTDDESECKDTFTVGASGITCSIDNSWVCEDNIFCLRPDGRCNGVDDCYDGSDERNC